VSVCRLDERTSDVVLIYLDKCLGSIQRSRSHVRVDGRQRKIVTKVVGATSSEGFFWFL